MPRIIMNRGFIARWTRMPHSTGRLSASVSSHHSLSSAAFITNIAESDFRHAQDTRGNDIQRWDREQRWDSWDNAPRWRDNPRGDWQRADPTYFWGSGRYD